jgi:hypothetical protein
MIPLVIRETPERKPSAGREGDIMEVRMGSQTASVVSGIDPVLAEIQHRLQAHPKEWLAELARIPGGQGQRALWVRLATCILAHWARSSYGFLG